MEAGKTPGNSAFTVSNAPAVPFGGLYERYGIAPGAELEVADLLPVLFEVLAKIDHLDDYAHRTSQEVSEMHGVFAAHRPAIQRAAAMMDPGAAARSFLGVGRGRSAKGSG